MIHDSSIIKMISTGFNGSMEPGALSDSRCGNGSLPVCCPPPRSMGPPGLSAASADLQTKMACQEDNGCREGHDPRCRHPIECCVSHNHNSRDGSVCSSRGYRGHLSWYLADSMSTAGQVGRRIGISCTASLRFAAKVTRDSRVPTPNSPAPVARPRRRFRPVPGRPSRPAGWSRLRTQGGIARGNPGP